MNTIKNWSTEIQELINYHKSLSGKFPDLEKELERLIKVDDEIGVLVSSRRCLEVIVTDICKKESIKLSKTIPLKGIIDKLNKENKVPSHIISSMFNLNNISTYGAHPKEFDHRQVRTVLINLITIIEWFIIYKDEKNLSIKKKSVNVLPFREINPEHEHGYFSEVIEKKSKRKVWKIATYFSAIIILVFVLFYIISSIKQSSDLSKLEKSIAVLPFKNWSYEEEFSHLGNAMANEIISELYKIREFRVISHTSTLQYKESNKTIPDIGQELGVNYIIEGIVERQGNQVNIHVQVIRAKNEDHIWAEEFDGEWKDIFKIQDEIALKVADELKTVLSENEMKRIEKKPTENLEAYNYYLRGNDFYSRSYEEQDLSIAINMYQKAIELDSNFALAYTMIAKSHLQLYWFHYDRSIERLNKSKKAIDAAFYIDPNLVDAFISQGLYYYFGFLDYSKALKQFDIALNLMPNNPESILLKACVYRRMGNWKKAEDEFIKAINYDPRSSKIVFNAAETYYLIGEYSKALEYLNLSINLNPDFISPYWYKINLFLKWEGNTKNARKTLNEVSLIINPLLDRYLVESAVRLDIFESKYQNAIDILSKTNFNVIQTQFYYYSKPLLYAKIYDLMLDTDKAAYYYNLSRLDLEARILDYPDDSRLYSSLGICYAGLGQKEQALDAGKKAVELLPISKEAWRGVYRLEDLARIYVMVGEYELALEELDLLLSIPGNLSAKLLLLDPIWKPLWNNPEFEKMIEKYSKE